MEPATEVVELSENIQVLFNKKRDLVNEFNILKNKIETLRNDIWTQKRKLNSLYANRETLDKRFNELVELKRKLIIENTERRSSLNKKLSPSKDSKRRPSIEEITGLERKLGSIEWKLQTEPKAKGLELKYVEEANRLRRELARKKKAFETSEEIRQLKQMIEEQSEHIDNINEELDDIRAKLEELKTEIRQAKEQLNSAIREENISLDKITNLRSQIEKVQSEINNLMSQKKVVIGKIRERENNHYQRAMEKRRAIVKEELRKKAERGEGLTFQELQLLYDEGE
ncbi:MAG: hypothetical protein ACUVQ8_01775 [Nitrososphaeria archaeon]